MTTQVLNKSIMKPRWTWKKGPANIKITIMEAKIKNNKVAQTTEIGFKV